MNPLKEVKSRLTQKHLAEKYGKSQTYISMVLSGKENTRAAKLLRAKIESYIREQTRQIAA